MVIKAVVTKDGGKSDNTARQATTLLEQQQLIQECVNQVLKIMKQSQNR